MLPVLIFLRSLVQVCNIQVFWESVNRSFIIFSNVSDKHFGIQTSKILLKYPTNQYTTATAQGQRCSSIDPEIYWQQYLGIKATNTISVIRNNSFILFLVKISYILVQLCRRKFICDFIPFSWKNDATALLSHLHCWYHYDTNNTIQPSINQ